MFQQVCLNVLCITPAYNKRIKDIQMQVSVPDFKVLVVQLPFGVDAAKSQAVLEKASLQILLRMPYQPLRQRLARV